jgi:competence protein ComFB
MRVHNLVEDLVVQKVEELFGDPAGNLSPILASDPGCKSDVVCYVLNRTPAMYVVSGRGVAHNETAEYKKKVQQVADITRLVKEGMESVAKNRRDRTEGTFGPGHSGPFFNFPSIIGRMFNGINFEPVHDVTVGLYQNGTLVKVTDPNWQNPYHLVLNTAGTYLFWPHPQEAQAGETSRTIELELRVDDPRYETLRYFFTLTASADDEFVDFVNTTASTRLKDLYLFPRD